MSRYAIGDITFLHQEEIARDMLLDAYQLPDDEYELIQTEFCVTCEREIFANEKCETCDQCIGFTNGCCTCKLGGD